MKWYFTKKIWCSRYLTTFIDIIKKIRDISSNYFKISLILIKISLILAFSVISKRIRDISNSFRDILIRISAMCSLIICTGEWSQSPMGVYTGLVQWIQWVLWV